MNTSGYRIDWTRWVPGGYHERESSFVRGDLQTVRDYLDTQRVLSSAPIVITEYTMSDQQIGRIVPASEWDIDPEEMR